MPSLEFRAMGCQMRAIVDADTDAAARALAAVPEWVAEWEAILSRFREDSELTRLNARCGETTRVSPVLGEVLNVAIRAARWSDGLVVPTLLAALEAAGYDRTFDAIVSHRREGGAHAVPLRSADPSSCRAMDPTNRKVYRRDVDPNAWRTIRWDPRSRSVQLPPGIRLDLGGIAKGWAAEQAARRLGAHGPALVDAGGDVAVSGPRASGEAWPIAVADPFAPEEALTLIALATGAVATSGRDYRRWRRDGVWQHHVLDPRTGRPARTDVVSATVIAPTAWQAEAGAKTALILGSRAGLAWIDRHAPLGGLLVLEDGRTVRSRRLGRYLWR